MKVQIKKIHKDAVIPQYESEGAAGFDFVTIEDVEIPSHELSLIPTGMVINMPEGYMLVITPRSSMPKKTGLRMPHSVGIIDSDYCGPEDEVMIQVYNPTDSPVTIKSGQKIAQGIFLPVVQCEFEEVEDLQTKTRGGFGSTGS